MSELEKRVEERITVFAETAVKQGVALTIPTMPDQMNVLSGYASYKLQKAVGEQTKELIKWNRRLAFATVSIAFFTFILALVTYLKR